MPKPRLVPPVEGALVPKVSLQVPGFVVLNLNQPVVACSLGLADPLSAAPVEVTLLAAEVTTEGVEAPV